MNRECKDCGEPFVSDEPRRKLCDACRSRAPLYAADMRGFKRRVIAAPYRQRISHASRS